MSDLHQMRANIQRERALLEVSRMRMNTKYQEYEQAKRDFMDKNEVVNQLEAAFNLARKEKMR